MQIQFTKKNRFNRMICNFVFNIALLSLNVHVKAKAIAFETKKTHIGKLMIVMIYKISLSFTCVLFNSPILWLQYFLIQTKTKKKNKLIVNPKNVIKMCKISISIKQKATTTIPIKNKKKN